MWGRLCWGNPVPLPWRIYFASPSDLGRWSILLGTNQRDDNTNPFDNRPLDHGALISLGISFCCSPPPSPGGAYGARLDWKQGNILPQSIHLDDCTKHVWLSA